MKIERYILFLLIAFVLAVGSSAHAQTKSYYALTDPGTTRPMGGAAPWVAIGGAGVPFPPNIGDSVWIGKENLHISVNTKNWVINGLPATFSVGVATGHIASPVSTVTGSSTINGTTVTIVFTPQPDWEVVRLVRSAASLFAAGTAVTTSSHCDRTVASGNTMTENSAFFGTAGEDNISINRIEIYPVGGTIGSLPSQVLAPANGGTWEASISTTDPNGTVRDGVRWDLIAGDPLFEGDQYDLSLEQGGIAVINYDLFAFDTVTPEVQEFPLVAGPGVPTVSEWGLVAMVLLVLVTGTIVFRKFGTRQVAA